MRRVVLREDQLRPVAVWGYYDTERSAVLSKKRAVIEMCTSAHAEHADPKFTGWSLAEIEEHFDTILTEVDHQISLSLLAAAEAAIRVDFFRRVQERGKDAVSRRLRSLPLLDAGRGDRNLRVRLDDILSVWASEVPACKSALARFRGALNYRHWLAHGRFWKPKLGMRYSPHIVQKTIEDLLEALGLA